MQSGGIGNAFLVCDRDPLRGAVFSDMRSILILISTER